MAIGQGELVTQGEEDIAFSRLVKRHYAMVYGVAFSALGDRSAAEDIAQDAFLVAWTKRGQLRNAEAFPMWIRRIARNLSINWIRSQDYRRALAEHQAVVDSSAGAREAEPERRVELEERSRQVQAGLDTLNPKVREAMVLFYIEGESAPDAAKALGVTPGALRLRLLRGRRVLRAHFEKEWEQQLKDEFIDFAPSAAQARIASALAVGPAIQLSAIPAAGPGLTALAYNLQVEGPLSIAKQIFTGGLIMSAKKAGVIAAVLVLALAGIFGGLNMLGRYEDSKMSKSLESQGDDFDVVAEDDVLANGEAGDESIAGNSRSARNSTTEMRLAGENSSVEKDAEAGTSGEDGGAIPTAAEKEHGKIADPDEYVSISGMVYDEKGNGVAGAQVMAQAAGYTLAEANDDFFPAMNALRDPQHHFSAVADADGAYTVTGIEYEGAMLVLSTAAGYTQKDATSVILDVKPGDTLEGVDILLVPGITAFGRVLSATGLPVDDGMVSLVGWTDSGDSSNGEMRATYTDAEGRFSIALHRPALATLLVKSPKYGAASFENFPIEEGGEEIELRMLNTASLTTSVHWPDGTAAQGVEVDLTGWHEMAGMLLEGDYNRGRSDAAGLYEFTEVDTGLFYRIELRGENRQALSSRIDIGRLAPGEARDWDYVIEKPIVVFGAVTGEVLGEPIRDIEVDVLARGGAADSPRNAKVNVDSEGRYELHILSGPGEYHVFPKHFWGREQPDIGQPIRLVAGEERELNLTMPDTFTISIRLVDILGESVPDAQVAIVQGRGINTVTSMRTDEEGRFSWSGFRPGQESSLAIERRGRMLARSTTVIGEVGEVVPEEILILHETGGIEGIALDPDGVSLANRQIAVLVTYGDDRTNRLQINTNELGEFVVLNEIPATEVYIDMQIASDSDQSPTSFSWQSELLEVPANQVIMLGEVFFYPEQVRQQKRRTSVAQLSR